MPNTSEITTIKLGMNADTSLYNFQKGQYSFALNAAIEDYSGNGPTNVQNEPSNYLAVNYPEGFKLIGKKYLLELDRTLVYLTNPTTGVGEIGEIRDCLFDDVTDKVDYNACKNCDYTINKENKPLEKITQIPYCTYRTIVSSNCFDFDVKNAIDIEYRLFKDSLYVYFVDGNNPLRFIYFDFDSDRNLVLQDRFKVVTGFDPDNCNQPIYSNELDCNKIRYNPNYTLPEVSFIEDVSGGSLKAGTYQVLLAYSDFLSNPLSKYFSETAPYPIKTKNITIDTDYITDRALSITIEGIDPTNVFDYYNIVIAQTINNFTTFYLVATLPVTTTHFIYTGDNQIIKKLDPTEIFDQVPIFQSAASITQANDYLFFARLKKYRKLNLQRAINRVKVQWQSIAIKEEDLRKARNVSKYRGFLRDEVYPLGLVVEFFDDNDTLVFPLTGPSKAYFQSQYNLNVEQIINNDDVITEENCEGLTRNKLYQVYNTAQIIGTPHEITNDCEDNKVWAYGDFAYWESTDTYPNIPEIWGDLCGQPIRFPKFPDNSISHIHDGLDSSKNFEDNNLIFPLGIRIDHQSIIDAFDWAVANNIISQEDRDRIKGYRIVRGNRAGNKSIEAKGLLYDVWNYNKYNKTYYYPNFAYNDLRPNIFLAPDDGIYNSGNDSAPTPSTFSPTGRYTFHSPDVHFTNARLATEIKLETEEYGKTEGYFNKCEEQPKYRILSTLARSLTFGAGVAAAFASITKDCRLITYNKTYVSELGVASGSIQIADTVGLIPGGREKFNTLFAPAPIPLPESVTSNDCKGTTYQWLSPGHIIGMAPEHGAVAAIMSGILILSEGISSALYFLTVMLSEMDIFTKLLQSLTPKTDYFIQYNSVGKYNSYRTVDNNGSKIRSLESKAYLDPSIQYVDEETTPVIFNNLNRESCVYLKTDSTKTLLSSPSTVDDSRVSMDNVGLSHSQLNTRFNRTISSYYASLKNFVPNQYGSVYNVNYLETNSKSVELTETDVDKITFFGGDTFINRFALKRKHPFFIQTRFRQLDDADVEYSELGNAAYPNYYLDYGEGWMDKLAQFDIGDILTNPGVFFQDLVGTDDTRLDAKQDKFFYQSGYVHLYNYGIPYFLAESDINVDFRHAENNTDKDYYPRQKDLDFWLQEKNVPITVDNAYIYNFTYSKQNRESVLQTIKPNTVFDSESEINLYNSFYYTEKGKTVNENDNWRIILNNSVFKNDAKYGAIVSVDGIEGDKVLIRSENGSQIFGAYDTISTSGGQAQLNKGNLFDTRPQQFAITDLGYMGSQNKEIVHSDFGHIFIDAKRGNIFNLALGGGKMDELTKNGMKNWFRNNLPFNIRKQFPSLSIDDTDNSYNGVGLTMSFDRRFDRFFLTKRDYKAIDPTVQYSSILREFFVPDGDTTTTVQLTDPKYFQDKSWTIAYNFATQTWISFYSFIPDYYIDHLNYFQSGINSDTPSLWSHLISNKSYQVFYGKLHPYVIDVPSAFSPAGNILNSIEYQTETIRYHNEYDYFYNENVTFNKAIVYTCSSNSGLLNLFVKNKADFSSDLPKQGKEGFNVSVTNVEGSWRINEFFDAVASTTNNVPIWLHDDNNVNKSLNKGAFNYNKKDQDKPVLRGNLSSVRFINDKYSNYKMIFLLNQFNQVASFK